MLIGNTFFVENREDELYIMLFSPLADWEDAVGRFCRQTGYSLVDHLDGPDHIMTGSGAQDDPDFLYDSPVADECPF